MDYYQVLTKLGPIYLAPTQGNHVNVNLNASSYTRLVDGSCPNVTYLQLRGVSYQGNIHLYRWSDGSWNYGMEFSTYEHRKGEPANTYERGQSIYIRRHDDPWRKDDTPSALALAIIIPEVVVMAVAWIKAHPEILAQAEYDYRLAQYERAKHERDEAYDKYILSEKLSEECYNAVAIAKAKLS